MLFESGGLGERERFVLEQQSCQSHLACDVLLVVADGYLVQDYDHIPSEHQHLHAVRWHPSGQRTTEDVLPERDLDDVGDLHEYSYANVREARTMQYITQRLPHADL